MAANEIDAGGIEPLTTTRKEPPMNLTQRARKRIARRFARRYVL